MAFDFYNYVTGGRAAEVANVGVSHAVAEAKALGLPVYGTTSNANEVTDSRDPSGRLNLSAGGIVSKAVHQHLQAEAGASGL